VPDDQVARRIADALERIAEALEKQQGIQRHGAYEPVPHSAEWTRQQQERARAQIRQEQEQRRQQQEWLQEQLGEQPSPERE
jgi:hypothetical protein